MDTAHTVVNRTLAALDGPGTQSIDDLLFVVTVHLRAVEGLVFEEPDRAHVAGLKLGRLVPKDLLPRPKKLFNMRPGFPDVTLFYEICDFIDRQLAPRILALFQAFGTIGREPRIMRLLHEMRREITIAVVDAAAAFRLERSILPPASSSVALLVKRSQRRPYQRLSVDTIHNIISFCRSFRDMLNLLSVTRWRKTAASTVRSVSFLYKDVDAVPTRYSEAWAAFQLFRNLEYIALDTPLANSVVPRMPAWNMPSALIDMSAREHWGGFNFWRTLGALGEEAMPYFTVVNPTGEVTREFCQQHADPAIGLSFVRDSETVGAASAAFDVVLLRASGHARKLCGVAAEFDRDVFDFLAFREVTHLLLSDTLRSTALAALYDLDMWNVEVIEVLLDADSEAPARWGEPGDRLLQQYHAFTPRMFNCPRIRLLRLSALDASSGPVSVSWTWVMCFTRLLTEDRIPVEYENVVLY